MISGPFQLRTVRGLGLCPQEELFGQRLPDVVDDGFRCLKEVGEALGITRAFGG